VNQDDRLESLLAPRVRAPGGFADRVMARVARTAQLRPRVFAADLVPLPPVLPWWVRAAFEPACALALVLAAALLWRAPDFMFFASSLASQLTAWLAGAAAPAPPAAISPRALLQPAPLNALAFGLAAPLVMATRALYRWSSHLAGPAHAGPAMR
jgi:hypothetical protein